MQLKMWGDKYVIWNFGGVAVIYIAKLFTVDDLRIRVVDAGFDVFAPKCIRSFGMVLCCYQLLCVLVLLQ